MERSSTPQKPVIRLEMRFEGGHESTLDFYVDLDDRRVYATTAEDGRIRKAFVDANGLSEDLDNFLAALRRLEENGDIRSLTTVRTLADGFSYPPEWTSVEEFCRDLRNGFRHYYMEARNHQNVLDYKSGKLIPVGILAAS